MNAGLPGELRAMTKWAIAPDIEVLNRAADLIDRLGDLQASEAELVARPLRQQVAALRLELGQLRTLYEKQQTRLNALRLIIDLDDE